MKACDFEPGFISQLNMYQNVVNDILCHPDDKPTIGLLREIFFIWLSESDWSCRMAKPNYTISAGGAAE
ncbi:hypothetical protein [uncultured Acetatifactor sp.]|uniref:hypothetical protein n=1 Tax=uncultured Acetatifactor sp. TaxID=1671927 RepID=UPI00262FB22C|nr:hypothetical protein [uncultured Acetatifactor sp.]